MISIRSKPIAHDHDPPDDSTLSSPSVSGLTTATTPTSDNCPSQTPLNATMDSLEALDSRTPTLTEILSPNLTLKLEPPKFPKLEEENKYLRQRVVELNYMNEALTNRLILLEKQKVELEETFVNPPNEPPDNKITTASQTDKNSQCAMTGDNSLQIPHSMKPTENRLLLRF